MPSPTLMPDARLARTRSTLPKGYQFGEMVQVRDLILMCRCDDMLGCEHRWPMTFPALPWRAPHENAAERLLERAITDDPGYGAGV